MVERYSLRGGLGNTVEVELIEDLGDGRASVRQISNGARKVVVVERLIGWSKRASLPSGDVILPPPMPTIEPSAGASVVASAFADLDVITGTELEQRRAEATSGARARPVAKPRKPARSEPFLERVRALPCCVCGANPPSDPHHFGPRGMSQKTDDYRCVPLCMQHHDYFHDHGVLPHMDRAETESFFVREQLDLVIEHVRQIEGT